MFIDKINITLRLGCLIRGFFKPDVFKKCLERLLLSCGLSETKLGWNDDGGLQECCPPGHLWGEDPAWKSPDKCNDPIKVEKIFPSCLCLLK